MNIFLAPQQHELLCQLNLFMSVINLKNDEEKHSNQWTVFTSVTNNDVSGFGLNHLLFLFTRMERIPPFGLEKTIDIEFADGDEPCISTCSYSVTLSATNAVKMLEMALK